MVVSEDRVNEVREIHLNVVHNFRCVSGLPVRCPLGVIKFPVVQLA